MFGAKGIIKPFTGMCLHVSTQYYPDPRRHQHSGRNLAGTTNYRRYIVCCRYHLAHLEIHPWRHGKMVTERSGL